MKACLLGLPVGSALALDSLMAAPRAPEMPPETRSGRRRRRRRRLPAFPPGAGIPDSGADVTEAEAEAGAGRPAALPTPAPAGPPEPPCAGRRGEGQGAVEGCGSEASGTWDGRRGWRAAETRDSSVQRPRGGETSQILKSVIKITKTPNKCI